MISHPIFQSNILLLLSLFQHCSCHFYLFLLKISRTAASFLKYSFLSFIFTKIEIKYKKQRTVLVVRNLNELNKKNAKINECE